MSTTVAGTPTCFTVDPIKRVPERIVCHQGKEISMQNVGINTIWISIDNKKTYFPVACGTSWDIRATVDSFWLKVKIGVGRAIIMVTT